MKRRIITVLVSAVVLLGIWVTTYFLWSAHLDKEIERRFEMMEAEPVVVSGVFVDSLGCDLTEISNETEVTDKIVDVSVTYPSDEIVHKQAYIVYADTDVPHYVDDKYGKIILPEEWNKNRGLSNACK